jgi:DNA-binding MarR family transcriptional regulator
VRRAFETRLKPIGLTMTQAALLSFVSDQGPLSQRELADRLHIGRASVGAFVDVLEQRGLVTRSDDPNDRRAWRISMTPEALELVEEFNRVDAELRNELRAGFSRPERHLLADLLVRIEANAVAAAESTIVGQGT